MNSIAKIAYEKTTEVSEEQVSLDSSGEISVGIMIGFIGAPVFIGIVRRRKLAQL